MKAVPLSLILISLVVFIRAVRQACPFAWVSMLPLCGGGPPDLYDIASFAVLLITARAIRTLRQRQP